MTPKVDDVVVLPDGRKLGYAEWGIADGTPVLYLPGTPTSRLYALPVDPLEQEGIRLIAIDRPGYGKSDAKDGLTLLGFVPDLLALADARGIDRFVVAGMSGGGPWAMATAYAAPDRVTVCGMLAGTDRLWTFTDLPGQIGGLVTAANTDPQAARAALEQMMTARASDAAADAESGPPGMSKVDRRVWESSPELRTRIASAFSETPVDRLAGAFARDMVLVVTDWGFDVAAVKPEVHLWYGEHDANAAHSPDKGRTLAKLLPNARHFLQPDDGTFVFWTKAREILRGFREAHERVVTA